MSKLILAPLFFLCVITSAQKKLSFASQNFVGLSFGQHGTKPSLQTINGVQHKSWFFGLGTGIDYYYLRSIPAFVSVAKDLAPKGGRNFFFGADLGTNYNWENSNSAPAGLEIENSKGGIYWGAYAGYKIAINPKRDALLLKLGYSYKYATDEMKPIYYYVDPLFPPIDEKYSYHLRRFSVSVGWKFM